MRGLRSSLYKDLKLFFSGAGLLSFALPLLLLPALLLGLGNFSQNTFLQPFPIAIRDEDQTIMSASLVSQIRHVELFSQIIVLQDGETDEDAIDNGAAAIATIPKDFFYDLYVMKACPVTVTLNDSMPLEASLFQMIFQSVMEIIRADHAAGQGVYSYCFGTLTAQQQSALFEETGMNLVKDALGRQQVFDQVSEASDIASTLLRRLSATLLSVLACFFSLSAVKTLPDEHDLGVLPRFQAAGGNAAVFVLSKYLTALLLTLPAFAAVCLLLREGDILQLLALHGLVLFAAFGIHLALAAWTKDASAVQRLGNLFLLLNLVLGGTVWPRQMLPQPLFSLSKVTIPYYSALGIEAISRKMSIFAFVWPLILIGAAGVLLSRFGFALQRRCPAVSRPGKEVSIDRLQPVPVRLFGLCRLKRKNMLGSISGALILVVALLICGAAANAASTGAASLRLAVCDLDQSSASKALTDVLQKQNGLSVTILTAQDARRSLLLGENEGLLTVGPEYEKNLLAEKDLPLRYESASGTVSSQSGREVIAGQVAAQKAFARAIDQAETLLGRELSDDDTQSLMDVIASFSSAAPDLYHIRTLEGIPAKDPFIPDQMAFSALAILFTLLTAAAWCGGQESRSAAVRLRSLPRGQLLALGSDCLSLMSIGLLTGICTLLPEGIGICLRRLPSLICYCFCTAALSLLLTKFSVFEGRIDGLAPLLALILCLLGGCFMDLSQVSIPLRAFSLLTPPGLVLHAAQYPAAVCCVLAGLGVLFLTGCIYSKKRL